MKLDEDVKMISAEAPVLFAKAAEIFITELTLRAWIHAEDNKRRTLQRNDIAMAISKYDQFDFLIDIVPRDEVRPTKREDGPTRQTAATDQLQYFLQVPQPTVLATPSVIQQPVQLSDIISPQQVSQTAATLTTPQQQQQQPQQPVAQTSSQAGQQQQQTLQVFTQVVGANGEMQQIPIQLTQSQIQAISMQMQGKQPGQSIVIRTAQLGDQQQQETDTATTSELASPQPLFQLPMYIQSGGSQQESDQQTTQLDDSQTET